MIEIFLLRHAETNFNAHNMFIGGRSNHIPLSEQGKFQSIEIGELFNKSKMFFDKVFCSPAERTKQTLEIILDKAIISKNEIEYNDDLQELSQGDWEGKLRAEIYTIEQLAEINSNNFLFKPPNGESQKEVEERMFSFIGKNIIEPYSDGKFLIVSHGVAIKCLLRGILNITSQMAYKIQIENTSLTKLSFDKDKGWFLNYLNWHSLS